MHNSYRLSHTFLNAVLSTIILCSTSSERGCDDFCRDAKVSVLDWDANNHIIATTSLHSFEGDATASASLPASPYGPRVLADPQVPFAARQLREYLQSMSSLIIARLSTGNGIPAVLAQKERVSGLQAAWVECKISLCAGALCCSALGPQ